MKLLLQISFDVPDDSDPKRWHIAGVENRFMDFATGPIDVWEVFEGEESRIKVTVEGARAEVGLS